MCLCHLLPPSLVMAGAWHRRRKFLLRLSDALHTSMHDDRHGELLFLLFVPLHVTVDTINIWFQPSSVVHHPFLLSVVRQATYELPLNWRFLPVRRGACYHHVSIRPCFTHRYCTKTIAQGLVFWRQKSRRHFKGSPPTGAPNRGWVENSRFWFTPLLFGAPVGGWSRWNFAEIFTSES